MATATITFSIVDLTLSPHDARRTKVWATTNVPGETVIDTTGNEIYLGSGTGSIDSDGNGQVIVPTPEAGYNPSTWQTCIHVDYPDRHKAGGRSKRTFGPFTITASANLADLIEEQEVPAAYLTTVTQQLDAKVAEAEAAAALAVDISNIDTTDAAVAAGFQIPESESGAYLSATIETGATLAATISASASKMRRTKAGLTKADASMFTVVTVGDSITEGRSASSRQTRWATRFAQTLADRYGAGVLAEYLPVYYETPTTVPQPATTTGTPTKDANYGPGQRAYSLDGSDSVTWTVTGSGVDVLYTNRIGNGTLRVRVDGAEVTTIDTSPDYADGKVYSYDFGSTGTHTVTVEAVSGTVIACGVIVYKGTRTSGVRHIDSGHSGWATQHFQGGGTGGTGFQSWLAAVSPNLITVALGANDTDKTAATYKTYLANIVTKARASGADPDFLFIATSKRSDWAGTASYESLVAAMREVAEGDDGVAFYDLNRTLGPVSSVPDLFADTVHPNDAGHQRIAELLTQVTDTATARPAVARESLWVPADRFVASAGTPNLTTFSSTYVVMQFDPAAQEGAVAWVEIPETWKAVDLVCTFMGAFAGTGAVAWRVQLAPQVVGAVASANASDVTVKPAMAGTQYVLQQSTHGQRIAVNPSATTLYKVAVIRAAADAGDTYASDASLVGVSVRRAA